MKQTDIMEHRITITGTNWSIIDISLTRLKITINSVSAGYITASDDTTKCIVLKPGVKPATNTSRNTVGDRIWRPGLIIIDMKDNPYTSWLLTAHKKVADSWPNVSSWFVACDEIARKRTGIDTAFITFPSIRRCFWLSTHRWINYSRLPRSWEHFLAALDEYYDAFATLVKAYTHKQERRYFDKKTQTAVLSAIENERNKFKQSYRDIEPHCIGQTSAAHDVANVKLLKTGKFDYPFNDVGVVF